MTYDRPYCTEAIHRRTKHIRRAGNMTTRSTAVTAAALHSDLMEVT